MTSYGTAPPSARRRGTGVALLAGLLGRGGGRGGYRPQSATGGCARGAGNRGGRTGRRAETGVRKLPAARMFSEEQLEQLRSFPDIGRDDLIRYFTLTQADAAFVDPGRGRGPADRLGGQ